MTTMRDLIMIVEGVADGATIERIARRWQSQFGDDGHVAEGPASRFNWHYDPDYRLARIASKSEILRYFALDQKHAVTDGRSATYFDELLNEPIREPVVVVDIGDLGYVWDGNHRIAACLVTHRSTIPAYVGRLKNPRQIWGPREK